ncbi:hypothetical protein [Rahnella sikkimica]|uniref:hypothetical protein n=1 Tax=Rahnella sikkimica TaxID=1805933 RepID=UPI0018659553|nr:hypothetical protein [Rahnella sikkimica]
MDFRQSWTKITSAICGCSASAACTANVRSLERLLASTADSVFAGETSGVLFSVRVLLSAGHPLLLPSRSVSGRSQRFMMPRRTDSSPRSSDTTTRLGHGHRQTMPEFRRAFDAVHFCLTGVCSLFQCGMVSIIAVVLL